MRELIEAVRRKIALVLNHAIARTAAVNLLSVVVTMFTGILLARGLGEVGRGMYASVVVWFGAALVLGELGQSAAVTFFVSRSPSSAKGTVNHSRRIMLASSSVIITLGIVGSSWLAGGDLELALAHVIAFSGVGVNALLAPYMYALQALTLSRWNLVRLSQPVLNFVAAAAWYLTAPFTVLAAASCLLFSYSVQMVLAYVMGRRAMQVALPTTPVTAGGLLRFGLKQASSAVPQTVAGSLDRIVLSQAGSPAALGQYAVAQSVVSAAAPLGTAISSVLFPRLSGFQGGDVERRAVEFRVLRRSAIAMSIAVSVLLFISPLAIPLVFGSAFIPAVELALWAAPAVLAQSLLGITATFLRGRGTPGLASWASLLSLTVGAFSMSLLVPHLSAKGAALGALIGSASGLVLALAVLRRSHARPCRTEATDLESGGSE